MNIISHSFRSEIAVALDEQMQFCCSAVNLWLESEQIQIAQILLFNVFVDAGSDEEYSEKKRIIENVVHEELSDTVIITLLAQSPAQKDLIEIELHAFWPPENKEIQPIVKSVNNIGYKMLVGDSNEKIVIVPEIQHAYTKQNALGTAEKTFQLMDSVLQAEGMNFSNIVRQWNYIQDITKEKTVDQGKKQAYQIFNDTRARFYSRNKFENAYPAATGIGTRAGGIVLSFFAVSGANTLAIPIENPLQIAAYSYSSEVLAGENTPNMSPKFARAKYIKTSLGMQLFISGTASIRGEETLGESVQEQTRISLENITRLISEENLLDAGIPEAGNELRLQNLRVYVKNSADVEQVRKICVDSFPQVKFTFVCADICRDNLLLEIEGYAGYS